MKSLQPCIELHIRVYTCEHFSTPDGNASILEIIGIGKMLG